MIKELKKGIRAFIKKYDVRYLGIFSSNEELNNEIPYIGNGIFLGLVDKINLIDVTLFSYTNHINNTLIQELKIHLPMTNNYHIDAYQITFIYYIS
jgi:hypothetical protein